MSTWCKELRVSGSEMLNVDLTQECLELLLPLQSKIALEVKTWCPLVAAGLCDMNKRINAVFLLNISQGKAEIWMTITHRGSDFPESF